MSLDTQTFGMSRYWLAVALDLLPSQPALFSKKTLCDARKEFLAGSVQIVAIKNWLTCAQVIESSRGRTSLTDLGKLMSSQDSRAENAWTWWLFHLHLCANDNTFPYCTFFRRYDPEGKSWRTLNDFVEDLCEAQKDPDAIGIKKGTDAVAIKSVATYFQGIEQTFRPTRPLYSLRLVERRLVPGEDGRMQERLRRRRTAPSDLVVLYAAMLFQHKFHPSHPTVEASILLAQGLGKSLGMRDSDVRDSLVRIHQDPDLGKFLSYSQAANLDSVQFSMSGTPALTKIRSHAYQSGSIQWP